MLSEEHLSAESFGTNVTFVRFVSRVYPDMHIVSYPLIKALLAPFALVFFGISMNFEVTA
jgi:hypothetical protein